MTLKNRCTKSVLAAIVSTGIPFFCISPALAQELRYPNWTSIASVRTVSIEAKSYDANTIDLKALNYATLVTVHIRGSIEYDYDSYGTEAHGRLPVDEWIPAGGREIKLGSINRKNARYLDVKVNAID